MAAAVDRHQAARNRPEAEAAPLNPAAFAIPRFGAGYNAFERSLQTVAKQQLWQANRNFYIAILRGALENGWVTPESVCEIEQHGSCQDAIELADSILANQTRLIIERVHRFIRRYVPYAQLDEFMLMEAGDDEGQDPIRLELSTGRMEIVPMWDLPETVRSLGCRVVYALVSLQAPFVPAADFIGYTDNAEVMNVARHYADTHGAGAQEALARDLREGNAPEEFSWYFDAEQMPEDDIIALAKDLIGQANAVKEDEQLWSNAMEAVKNPQTRKDWEAEVGEWRRQGVDIHPDWFAWFRMAFAAIRYLIRWNTSNDAEIVEPGCDYQPFGMDSIVVPTEELRDWVERGSEAIQGGGEPFVLATSVETPGQLVASLRYVRAMLLGAAVVYAAMGVIEKGANDAQI